MLKGLPFLRRHAAQRSDVYPFDHGCSAVEAISSTSASHSKSSDGVSFLNYKPECLIREKTYTAFRNDLIEAAIHVVESLNP